MNQQTENLLKQCLPMFEMMGDANRQTIMSKLFYAERLNVSELTELLHLSRPAVSHHLKLLLQAELVNVVQEGKERYYSLNLALLLQRMKAFTESLEADIRERDQQTDTQPETN